MLLCEICGKKTTPAENADEYAEHTETNQNSSAKSAGRFSVTK
jgi:hypothetical protein